MSEEVKISDVTSREAEPKDNDNLCELFKSISMKTDLHLTVERDPDFFKLYKIQRAEWMVWATELNGNLEAIGTMMKRPAYIDGKKSHVGYAGDLRLTRKLRGGNVLGRVFGGLFNRSMERYKVPVALTAIIHSNKRAVKALVARNPDYPEKPNYKLLRKFRIRNVQFTFKKKPKKSDYKVRRATEEDIPAIAKFLDDDHRKRPFGYPIDEDFIRWRLKAWPDFSIEDFFLAFDKSNKMVGITATWDPSKVKRFRVLGYHNQMKWIRMAFNIGSFIFRYDRLPPAGSLFNYFYLTHVSILDENPDIMKCLIDRIYAEFHGKGYQFFTCFVMDDDPLAPAFKGYRYTDLPTGLYLVSPHHSPVEPESFGEGRPGFEMALV